LAALLISGIVLISEIVLGFLFSIIAQVFYKKTSIDFKSLFKGFIERMFLMIFLFHDIAPALTFFSALKIATRLKHEEPAGQADKFNDYYLIGNLVSVTVSLFYVYLLNSTKGIDAVLHLL
jgi:ABC-type xylose transport system permease subunit